MKTFLQVMAFSVIVLSGFNWFSNSIPQMRAMPPVEEKISLEGLTPETYAALGKRIFFGKANCPLCHNAVGHRAPLLEAPSEEDGPPVVLRAGDRLKDPRYKGKATTGLEYILESMVEPSIFVVAGFGKTGTNDTVSPMPIVINAPMSLSDLEVNAVIAYLQQSAGVPITVEIPAGGVEMDTGDEGEEEPAAVKTMEELAEKYECRLCHMVPGIGMEEDEADLGPPLAGLSRFRNGGPKGMSLRDYIRQSILDPNAIIVEDFDEDTMPLDFKDKLRISELELAVEHLAKSAEEGAK